MSDAVTNETWERWADEGGRRIRFSLMPNGAIKVEILGSVRDGFEVAEATLANFRVAQLPQWMQPEAVTAFEKGVASVTCIRCTEHRAVPLINTNEAGGGECGACIKAWVISDVG